MLRFLILSLLLTLFCTGCQPLPPSEQVLPRFIPSKRPPVKVDASKTPYTFGYLEVPENRQRPDGKSIQLPVYIFKSRSAHPAPDPVLYTVGGPGSSSLSAAPYMRAFAYLEDRDLILFEQRGTRYAKPHLACPEWAAVAPTLAGQRLSASDRNSAYVDAARQCRDRLLAQGIDLDGYHTKEIAADIEDLRQVLGLNKLNLLTISYSTKIAQVMMREYPNSLRSVVMDSPLPLAVSYDETSISNLMAAYDTLFADCAKIPDCNAKHPQLRQRFLSFIDSIQDNPIRLTVAAPSGEETVTRSLTGKDLIGALASTSTGEIPSFLGQLGATLAGDTTALKAAQTWPTAGTGEGIGMRLSVWCKEELAFVDPARVAAERARFPALAGLDSRVFSYEVCQAWNVRQVDAKENEPVFSDVPTLLISGTYDTDTPVTWATQMNKALTNSHHLQFPGWAHGPTTYWDDPCAMLAAKAFFSAPDRTPTLPCLDDLQQNLVDVLSKQQ